MNLGKPQKPIKPLEEPKKFIELIPGTTIPKEEWDKMTREEKDELLKRLREK